MRQLNVGVATVAIFAREGEAAAKCAGVDFGGDHWFEDLKYCGVAVTAPYTASTLRACVNDDSVNSNDSLTSILGGSKCCATCALSR